MPQFTDTALCISSSIIIDWFQKHVQKDLYTDDNLSVEEYHYRIMANFELNIDFQFPYFFAVIVICLLVRISVML